MNKKKTIITAVVLLLVLLIGGLLAYFTDSDTRTNVFTIGNVEISLDEAGWNEVAGGYSRTEATNIMPGTTVAKAPTVTNEGSVGAYIFLKVEIPQENNADIYTINGVDATNWYELSNTAGTHVYVYGTDDTKANMKTLAATDTTAALCTGVTLKSTLTSAPANANITVTAYGIQANNVTEATPAAIYALFNN